jgi:FKBP-type peptidyl-prolyl cis-trans isomerase SlyD
MSADNVAPGVVVGIDYRLTVEDGTEVDNTSGRDPLHYLHGHGNIVPGLESALEGLEQGASIDVELSPEDAFGVRDEQRVVEVERERLDFDPEIGAVVAAQLPDGRMQHLQIAEVTDDIVTLDGNHPLAGETVRFEVTVRSLREATDEEIAAGQVD